MKNLKKHLLAAAFSLVMLMILPVSAFAVLTGTTSDGWDVFDPSGGGSFRYGPSIIINADNSIDMWTCSPGSAGTWDNIRYKRSTDGGLTWGTESIALQPTAGSPDAFSTCDPGVVKFGGYYYLSYTSTTDSRGINNEVYVGRSTSPGGPYSKWNGSGWGGNPVSFIKFTDSPFNTYGAGEPSLVVKDTTLYVYYTWLGRDVSGKATNQTRVSTVSTTNANWPGSVVYQGIAITKETDGDDSTDHKYVPSLSKFIAVGSSKRFSNEGYIKIYESTDGITYKPGTLPKNYLKPSVHNAGISGNELGQFDTTKNNVIGYAYGTTWAFWYTAFQPFTLTNTNLPAIPVIKSTHSGAGNVTLEFRTTGVAGESYKISYGTASGSYSTTLTGITSSPYTISGLTNGTPYYIVVVANNATGDSANSTQVSAIPLSYSTSPRTAVSASSQLAGWAASYAIDASLSTTWSSNGYTTSAHTEWISVDTGGNRAIKRVTVAPRQGDYNAFPGFKVQVSLDASTWADADIESRIRIDSPNMQIEYLFKNPLYGRYVRLYTDVLSTDGSTPDNYYFQLADIKIEEIPFSASSSSNIASWEPYKAIDGINSTWSSVGYASAIFTEWLAINTGDSNVITGVRLKPRDNYCFPVDFKFQSSADGTTWTDIPGASYAAYPNPGTATQIFKFNSSVTAKHIRLFATKLSADSVGNFYAQIGDFIVDSIPSRVSTASTSLAGWAATKAADNQNDTYWSSNGYASPAITEWIQVDMGSTQNWSGLYVQPRPGVSFPVDFTIQYSTNGTTWTTVPGASFTHYYYSSPTTLQQFPFQSIISARYLRINATKLGTDGSNYYFQLGEVYAYR